MSIGPAEIIIVLILALLVFGPKRLPQMGKSLGKGVREFRKAAETAKTELGLGEVTDQINEVKSTFTGPIKDVTGTFGDLKSSVDLKSSIEAPVGGAVAAAGAAGAAASASTPASLAPAAASASPVAGAFEEGPETPAVTPQTVFSDVPRSPAPPDEPGAEAPTESPEPPVDVPVAPAAPESPEGTVAAGAPAGPATGA
jgi:TatA/E family protein of Tat protein translocase